MEERRLLVAIALSLLVLTAWRYLVAPPAAPQPTPKPAVASAPATPAPAIATPGPPAPLAADDRERRVEIESEDLDIAFTNRGARLIRWRLKRYREEMVQAVTAGPRPLDLETGDAGLDQRLREALFQASAERLDVSAGAASLRFRFADAQVQAEKMLRFEPKGFLSAVSGSVHAGGRALPTRVVWGPGLANPTAEEKQVQGYEPPQGVFLTARGVDRVPATKLSVPLPLPEVAWTGVENRYFAALLVPPGGRGAAELRAHPHPTPEGETASAVVAVLDLPPASEPAHLYVGPKDYMGLARLGHGLAAVVPVGDWIGPIVVVMMRLLGWLHSHVGSYGWSIVVLTVLINLALSPLRHYSIANGMKMAKLSPEMKVIQDRYKGIPALDKRRELMQKEIAALYAKHGMSMGTQLTVGCLPMLLTLPFLFAIYRVLQVSIELRGAPFLWIPDLSQKDPLYLTPLLMGASMVLMQKMTPSTMDPAQQRMMMMMPLVFMVMFFAAPGGLNLYWLASNVCSIAQQAVTLRLVRDGRGEVAARAERRRR